MTETEKANICKVAAARALAELRSAGQATGYKFQVWLETDGASVLNFYSDEEHRTATPIEMAKEMDSLVRKVEEKGQLTKPVLLGFVNKFKQLIGR